MKLNKIIFFLNLFFSISTFAAVNPLTLKQWSNEEKYLSPSLKTIPFLGDNYFAYAGFNLGLKNGSGLDLMLCKRLNRYLCGGARLFVGKLNSESLIRAPLATDLSPPKAPEYYSLLATPESWASLIPELGFAVNSQIIPLNDGRWSESAWFGLGKAILGSRSGWTFSLEEGINHTFEPSGNLGWTLRVKYSFGWLNPKVASAGTIPFDWFNLAAGIFYVW